VTSPEAASGTSPSKRVLLLANPISGRGRGKVIVPAVADALTARGFEPEVRWTGSAQDAQTWASEADPSLHAIAAAGGDGTVNLVATGLAAGNRLSLPIAMIPVGTANVLRKEFNLPRDADGIADAIAARRTTAVDRCWLEGGENGATKRPFLIMVSTGVDAMVVDRLAAKRVGTITKAAYVKPTLAVLLGGKIQPVAVEVDGNLVCDRARLAVVANCRSYGAPWEMTSLADPADGLLEVVCVTLPVRLFLPAIIGAAFVRKLHKLPGVHRFTGRDVVLRPVNAGARVPFQMDGEPGALCPVRCTIGGDPLRMIVP
jgi:diacylglycerol kinase family enzyme